MLQSDGVEVSCGVHLQASYVYNHFLSENFIVCFPEGSYPNTWLWIWDFFFPCLILVQNNFELLFWH